MTIRRKLFWSLNFLILGAFTFYAAIGVLGVGAHHAYADALDHDDFYRQSHNFVVVHGEHNGAPDPGGSGLSSGGSGSGGGEEICSLTPTQEQELDAFFNVQLNNITVSNGDTVQVAIVSGRQLTQSQLTQFLRVSDQSLNCQVVGTAHVFFLPVLPQIS